MLEGEEPILVHLPEIQIQLLIHILGSNEIECRQLVTKSNQQGHGFLADLSLLELTSHHLQGLSLLGNDSSLGLLIRIHFIHKYDDDDNDLYETYGRDGSFGEHGDCVANGIHHRLLFSSNPTSY